MKITKMHGLGNSQILVKDLEGNLEKKENLSYNEIARALCDQNYGIGSDQMLIINSSKKADFQMRVFNRDGGEAEMCGNGIRCVAKYLHDRELVGEKISIETLAGIKELRITSENGAESIDVNMGIGKIIEEEKKVNGFEGTFVSVGNPHFVIFTDEASEDLARKKGPSLEKASEFQPKRTNVEFAKIVSENCLEVYVWERGAGLTLACGTGACATAFASKSLGHTDSEVEVKLLGGSLEVTIDENSEIRMKGPAEYILEGKVFDVSKIHSNL